MRKTFLILAILSGLALSYAREIVANVSLLDWQGNTLLMRADFINNATGKLYTRLFKVTPNNSEVQLVFPTEKHIGDLSLLEGTGLAEEQLLQCVPIPNTDRLLLLYPSDPKHADKPTDDDTASGRRLFVVSTHDGSIAEIRLPDVKPYLHIVQEAGLQIDGQITPDIFDISLHGKDLVLTLLTRFSDGVGTVSFIVTPDMNPISLATVGDNTRHPTDDRLTLRLYNPLDEAHPAGLYEIRLDTEKQTQVVPISPHEVRRAKYAPNGDIVGYVRSSPNGVSTIEVWFRTNRTTKTLPLPLEVKSGTTVYKGHYTENFIFSPDSRLMAIPVRAFIEGSRYEWHVWFWNVRTGQVETLRLPFAVQSGDE